MLASQQKLLLNSVEHQQIDIVVELRGGEILVLQEVNELDAVAVERGLMNTGPDVVWECRMVPNHLPVGRGNVPVVVGLGQC